MTYLDLTRIVEEVPDVQNNERYYLWHEHKVAGHFSTLAEAQGHCADRGIHVDEIEPFGN